jgi:F-type H+-transporting ATPase subunit a
MIFDFSITHEVILVWIAAAVTMILMIATARVISANLATTGKFGNLMESLVDFVRSNIVDEFLGHHGKAWFGFFATLFFFILSNNLLGKLPIPGFHSPTGNINVTCALAVTVFLVCQVVGIVKLGPVGYFKRKFLLPGAPVI